MFLGIIPEKLWEENIHCWKRKSSFISKYICHLGSAPFHLHHQKSGVTGELAASKSKQVPFEMVFSLVFQLPHISPGSEKTFHGFSLTARKTHSTAYS